MLLVKKLNLYRGLLFPVLLLALLILIGTMGYVLIDDFTFFEGLYMTVITVSTVGFMEVKPLTEAGRIFTIFLILVNIGLFAYFITLISHYLFDLDLIKQYKLAKMNNKIQHLQGHVIICGFGRNGKESAQVLHANKIPFVVLEKTEELDQAGLFFEVPFFIKGDGTKDEMLLEAGIKNARALITTLPVDADNLFVVLSAKQLNAAITIISRASQDSSVNKLKIAGANNVIMPDKIGGTHMATLVLQPDVVELLTIMSTRSNSEFRIAELKTNKNILLSDLDLWNKTNCTILGIKNAEKSYDINPPANYQMNAGESLIVMGSDEQISQASLLL
jgi:voltage-gated potassium channel